MSGVDDLVQWLGGQLDEDERIALKSVEQAAVNLNGADAASVADWHVVERPATGTFVATRDQWERVTEIVPTYGGAHSEFIAEHDPARVLREVDAKRQLLADITAERHLVNQGDCWYTCPAATEERDGGETCDDNRHGAPCDCGRDARVERQLRLLALPYAGRDGYRAEWAPTA